MSGPVIFALTAQQAIVLRKLHAGERALSAPERVAFFALARRGMVRGSLVDGDAHLTHAGEHAARLAGWLHLEAAAAAGRVAIAIEDRRRGADRRRRDRAGGRRAEDLESIVAADLAQ